MKARDVYPWYVELAAILIGATFVAIILLSFVLLVAGIAR